VSCQSKFITLLGANFDESDRVNQASFPENVLAPAATDDHQVHQNQHQIVMPVPTSRFQILQFRGRRIWRPYLTSTSDLALSQVIHSSLDFYKPFEFIKVVLLPYRGRGGRQIALMSKEDKTRASAHNRMLKAIIPVGRPTCTVFEPAGAPEGESTFQALTEL
jgi:hypothetical protein